jgi:hypothetical protein
MNNSVAFEYRKVMAHANQWKPKFTWLDDLLEVANTINKPHEDYPLRVPVTSEFYQERERPLPNTHTVRFAMPKIDGVTRTWAWYQGFLHYKRNPLDYYNPHTELTDKHREYKDGWNYAEFQDALDSGYYDWVTYDD